MILVDMECQIWINIKVESKVWQTPKDGLNIMLENKNQMQKLSL